MNRVHKSDIVTLPNLLSFLRILMVPILAYLYLVMGNLLLTAGLLLLSGVTDIADGQIARRFHTVTDLGKLLDPLADKLTQGVMLVCLCTERPILWILAALFGWKEIATLCFGVSFLKNGGGVRSSRWHGKLNTVILYGVMLTLLLFPSLPKVAVYLLLTLSSASLFVTFILYAKLFLQK